MLARLPLLHPEGLRDNTSDGPADPLRRIVKDPLVDHQTPHGGLLSGSTRQLELLGPAWYDALGTRYGKATLALLARYADPNTVIRLGHARLTRFLIRHSRGAWREPQATLDPGCGPASPCSCGAPAQDARIDFAELAADIAIEAEQAQIIDRTDRRPRRARRQPLRRDRPRRASSPRPPASARSSARSSPGASATRTASTRLAAIRAYSGLVPKVSQSGQSQHQHGLTKAGDPLLREALFTAADHARKIDPQLAAKYKRLMQTERHHDSATCHIATVLLTRIGPGRLVIAAALSTKM